MINIYSKILLVLGIIFVSLTSLTYSQIIRCGVQDLNPEDVQQLRDAFNQWLSEGNRVAEGIIVTIPVSFHIIRYDNGSADVTDQQINDQISVLNSSYANTNFRFSLNSIERINNTSWTTHSYGSQQEIDMKQTLADDPAHVLNFYICGAPKDEYGNILLGYSTFPWMYAEDNFMHGVVVLYSSLPDGTEPNYNEGDTGTHEIGHFVGEFHTFQGSPDGCTPPGDEVEDTPYESSPAFGCPTGRNTCTQPGDDPIHNFMDYTYDSCMDHFTTGQSTRMDEIMSQYRPSMLLIDVNVTIDQRNSFNQQVGELRKWEGTQFTDPPFSPGTLFDFLVNSQQTILGDQTVIGNQKYNNWNQNKSNVVNHATFTITSETSELTSHFEPTYSGVTIKNSLEGTSVTGGTLSFKDPWFIDYPDPSFGSQKRNRGMDQAEWYNRTSPFYPDYNTSYENGNKYQGVFLNQLISSGTYYKVWAGDQQINLGGSIGVRNFYFQDWTATGATFQTYDNEAWPVFTSSSAVVQANLKGQGLSNNQNAYTNNSQRKFVKTDDGFLHNVYESMGKVWYEYSSNNGATWQLVPLGEGKNPTIDFFQNYIIIAMQVDVGSGGAIAAGCFVKSGSTYIQTNWIYTDDVTSPTLPPYEINANPVIAITFGWYVDFPEILLIWDHPAVVLPAGIYYMRARLNVTTNQIYWVPDTYPVKITNTNINSNNPTIYATKNAGHVFHIAWGQSQSSIKYCSATASISSISFSSIITPSSGSGFTIHYNPSIIEIGGSGRITWAAKYNSSSLPVVVFKASDYYRFWNFGGNVSAPNINKSNDNTYYTFTWSESGTTTKFADNSLSTMGILILLVTMFTLVMVLIKMECMQRCLE